MNFINVIKYKINYKITIESHCGQPKIHRAEYLLKVYSGYVLSLKNLKTQYI